MSKKMTQFQEEIILYFKARFTLIYVITSEEERVIKEIADACREAKRPCHSWDIADGFVPLTEDTERIDRPAKDPVTALDTVKGVTNEEMVFVLKDFHSLWDKNPQVVRKIKNLAQALKQTKKSMIITAHTAKIPEEIKDQVYCMEFSPPDYQGIKDILDTFTRIPNVKVDLSDLGRDKMIRSALGLTANQTQRVFAKAIVKKGRLDESDISLINREKKEIIRESGALEFFPATETINQIGGLDLIKQWFRERERCFSQEAVEYGIQAPKGLLLMGESRGLGKVLLPRRLPACGGSRCSGWIWVRYSGVWWGRARRTSERQ